MLKRTLFCLAFSAFLAPLSLFADSPHTTKTTAYVVQKGDSLWKISKITWGGGQKWTLLYATNQEKIKDPNLIYAGQKLTIPANISKEELKKAAQLVQEKLPAAATVAHKKSHKSASQENTASDKPIGEKPESAQNPPADQASAPVTQAQPPAAAPEGSSHVVLWVAIVIALVLGGAAYFFKKMQTPPQQQPRPISSFQQTNQPAPNRAFPAPSSTPASTTTTASNVTPIRPVATPSPAPSASPTSPSSTISGIPMNRPSQPAVSPSNSPAPAASTSPMVDSAAADSLIQQGRLMEAAKVYRAILEKDPGNVEMGKKLVQVEEKMRLKSSDNTPAQASSGPSQPKQADLPAVSPSNPPMNSGTVTSVSSPPAQTPPFSTPPAASPQQAETKPSDSSSNPPGQGTNPT